MAPEQTPPRALSVAELERLALGRVMQMVGALGASPRWNKVVLPALLRWRDGDGGAGPVEEIVCYSLGCLADANVAVQVALLLLMANALAIPVARRLVYDPRHTPMDKLVLTVCGLTVLDQDEQGERVVERRTLFYMPFSP